MSIFEPSIRLTERLPELDQHELFANFAQGYDLVQLLLPQIAESLAAAEDYSEIFCPVVELMVNCYRSLGMIDTNLRNDIRALITLSLKHVVNGSPDSLAQLTKLFDSAALWAETIIPDFPAIVWDAVQSAVAEVGIDSYLVAEPQAHETYGIALQTLTGATDTAAATQLLDIALAKIKAQIDQIPDARNVIILNGGRTIATELNVLHAHGLPSSTSHSGTELAAVEYDQLRLANLLRQIDLNPEQPIIIYDDGVDRGATLMKLLVEVALHKGLHQLMMECMQLYELMLEKLHMQSEQGRYSVAQRFWNLCAELKMHGVQIVAAVDKLCGVDPTGSASESPFLRLSQVVDVNDDPELRLAPSQLPWLMGRGGFDTKVNVLVDGRILSVSIGRNLPFLVRVSNPANNPIARLQQLVIDFLIEQLGIDATRVNIPMAES
jgi:hypothetical protein